MTAIRPLHFVHVPMSDGNGFRVDPSHCVGSKQIHCDYGENRYETSPLVKDHFYRHGDLFALRQKLRATDCRLFYGFMPLARYAPIFALDTTVTFVRNPVAQTRAYYDHFRGRHGFQGSILDFLQSPCGRNLQSRSLSGPPVEALGFVGVADRFDESAEVFEHVFGTEISYLPLERTAAPAASPEVSDTRVAQAIRATSSADFTVYERARQILDARLWARDQGYLFAQGKVESVTRDRVSGFAFYEHSNAPVTVELRVNDKRLSRVMATRPHPKLAFYNAPRNGFVGFDFTLIRRLQPGARVQCRVPATGRILGEQVWSG